MSPRRRRVALGRPPRRLRASLVVTLLLLSVLAGRLIQLQVVGAAPYAVAAEKQRLRTVALPAERGSILDRDGQQLAVTVDARAVTADPQLVDDPADTARRLATVLDVQAADLESKLRGTGRYVVLAHRVDLAVADAVHQLVAERQLAGIFTEHEPRRVYPNGGLAASVLGFVGSDGHGLAGIEDSHDELLAGRDGVETMETDSAGRQIPQGRHTEREPVPGSDIVLTLDRDLQWTAQRVLRTQVQATGSIGGTVTVLDPRTGEVLALASEPGFDPNRPGAAPKEHRGNPALSEVYEPGSVNKVITAAAALERGIVTPASVITVPPSVQIADKAFTDAHDHGTQRLTFAGVLAKSSNVGTILVAQRLGKQALYDSLRAFGFGERSGLGWPGESPGLLLAPSDWYSTSAGTIPIGQGVSVTSIQVASVFATIANGGVRVPPRLLRGTVGQDGRLRPTATKPPRRVIDAKTAAELTAMLEAATSEAGTAPEARLAGYRVAGKTGTARRVDPACSCYRGYSASFIGFAPAEAPRLVVQVVLHDPKSAIYGGAVAAPVFHDVLAYALQRRGIPPTGAPPPPPLVLEPGR